MVLSIIVMMLTCLRRAVRCGFGSVQQFTAE
jgi:hypothetical protein